MATLLSADQIIRQPLPDYRTGAHTTQSSAIHETRFVGNLTYWAEFEGSVETWYQGKRQTFSPQGIFPVFNSNVPNLLTTDYIRVGDETGIQGRFEERVGQVLSLVSSSENLGFKFADSRCALNRGEGIPDFAIIDNGDNAVVTGELKVPWVYAHSLATAVDDFHDGDQKALRGLLGQVALYMGEQRVRYGVLTTYKETIFLRQYAKGPTLSLQFSPVILHTTRSSDTLHTVSLHQAFLWFARRALDGPAFEQVRHQDRKRWTS